MRYRGFIAPLTMLTIFGLCLTVAINVQRDAIAKLRRVPPFFETWELAGRSGDVMKYLTLRYDGVAADFLWLRAIQSFGGRGMTNRDWVPLYNLFDAITELDPYFEAAYTFGNLVIGDEGGRQEEALRLLDKGTWKIYRRYRCPFEGLYVAQWAMKDPRRAAYYGRVAKKRPDAPDWLPRIVAYVEIASGEYYIGFDRYLRNLLEAIDQDNTTLEDIALNKTAETILFWNASVLRGAIDRHTSATGTLPSALMRELADDPEIAQTEIASFPRMFHAILQISQRLGRPEPIDSGTINRTNIHLPGLAAAMEAEKADVDRLIDQIDFAGRTRLSEFQQDIFRISLVKRPGIPADPYGRGMAMNLTFWGAPQREDKEQLTKLADVEAATQDILAGLRAAVKRRAEELGRNPADWREVFFTDFKTTEPLGGQWIYNPETGEVKSSSFPDL